MLEYRAYFTLERWSQLGHSAKKRHSYLNCVACAAITQFALKKSNGGHVDRLRCHVDAGTMTDSNNVTTPSTTSVGVGTDTDFLSPPAVVRTPCTKPYTNEVGDALRQQLETTPRIMNVVDVPLHSRRQIIRESREEQRAMTTQNDAAAVFSTNISLNQHNKARRIRYAEFHRHPEKNHTGNLESYRFDRDMASRTFMENADLDGCLDSLAGRWAALA